MRNCDSSFEGVFRSAAQPRLDRHERFPDARGTAGRRFEQDLVQPDAELAGGDVGRFLAVIDQRRKGVLDERNGGRLDESLRDRLGIAQARLGGFALRRGRLFRGRVAETNGDAGVAQPDPVGFLQAHVGLAFLPQGPDQIGLAIQGEEVPGSLGVSQEGVFGLDPRLGRQAQPAGIGAANQGFRVDGAVPAVRATQNGDMASKARIIRRIFSRRRIIDRQGFNHQFGPLQPDEITSVHPARAGRRSVVVVYAGTRAQRVKDPVRTIGNEERELEPTVRSVTRGVLQHLGAMESEQLSTRTVTKAQLHDFGQR